MSNIDFEETLGIKNETIVYILVVVIIGFCFLLGVLLYDYLYDLTQEEIQHRKNIWISYPPLIPYISMIII